MAETNQLNFSWLTDLTNPNHDGTTQQIDDFVQAYQSDNAVFNQKKAALHTARQDEDDVWLTSQRDDVVPLLEAADKKQDKFVTAARYIIMGHSGLPDGELTQAEAKQCEQVFTDYKFHTTDTYGAEADKIIQMQQNFESHQSFLTQIGAWTFFQKAVEQAQLVRQYLGERAKTLGEFVKGEMKTARANTDQAIADLYKVINAMMELMPSAELTELVTQLKGIELYAKRYYISGASGATPEGGGGSNENENQNENGGGTEQGGTTDSGNSGTTEPGGTGTITPGTGGSNENDNENENGGTGSGDDNGGGNGGSGMDQN